MTTPPLVAVAHGSRDPRAAASVTELMALVRERSAGIPVRTAFLEHAAPSLPQVLGSLAPEHGECVVVPLLLASAYHAKTDIPGQTAKIRSAYPGLNVAVADPLGPHPALLRAVDRRLAAAWSEPRPCAPDRRERDHIGHASAGAGPGGRPPVAPRSGTSLVLAAAGSSDPSANAANAALAAQLRDAGGWRRVVTAYASAASPAVAEAVAALRCEGGGTGGPVVVATYLLAPGYFADKVRDTSLAAGAAAVSDPLGAAPEVADVIVSRYLAEAGGQAAAPRPARPLMARPLMARPG